jgi:hypothetical protein
MAEEKKGKHSKRHSSGAKTALTEHEELMHAVDGFIRANANFESSVVLNTTIEMVGACTTLQDVFTTVLQRQLLSMEGALLWTLFLSLAPARAAEMGDRPFSGGSPFSTAAALSLIASVYDLGVAEVVSEHFEYDSDSESGSESESETDDKASSAGAV